ncbi:hypothetical protein ACO2Q8_27660 [Larkinella sp. VNQ87]|uniref:hypothetical protein n=1 Tax=Larkinella sp. VNQ87 TaxID=3400921 RepID=UPI003C10A145
MNLKFLTIIAFLGAPFLAVGVYTEVYFPALSSSWWTGLWGLLYCTGWMGSLEALRRLELAGTDRFGTGNVWSIQIGLIVANASNVWQLVAPSYKPDFFWILDTAWPLSNLLMLPLGIAVLRAHRLSGLQRWVPLAVGLWLPLSMALRQTAVGLHVSNGYSLIAWSVLALTVRQAGKNKRRFTRSEKLAIQ